MIPGVLDCPKIFRLQGNDDHTVCENLATTCLLIDLLNVECTYIICGCEFIAYLLADTLTQSLRESLGETTSLPTKYSHSHLAVSNCSLIFQ